MKRGDPNKRGGRKIFQNLINGVVLIRAWRVENVPRINKRVTLFIRQIRVSREDLNADSLNTRALKYVIFCEENDKSHL